MTSGQELTGWGCWRCGKSPIFPYSTWISMFYFLGCLALHFRTPLGSMPTTTLLCPSFSSSLFIMPYKYTRWVPTLFARKTSSKHYNHWLWVRDFFAEVKTLRTIHMHFNPRIWLPDGTFILEPRHVQYRHHLPGASQTQTIMNYVNPLGCYVFNEASNNIEKPK